MSFTWIPLYSEIAHNVLEFENRQDKLLSLLQKMKADGLKVVALTDRDAAGELTPLAEIDPFTFFASFNRHSSVTGRQAILARIKDAWHLSAPVPDDFDGIPTANPQSSWAFAYLADRTPNDIPILWRAAREGVAKSWRTFDRTLFDEALNVKCCGVARLSMSLFWLNPQGFLACEQHTRSFFKVHGIVAESWTAAGYFSWLEQVVANAGEDFPQISLDAYHGVPPAEEVSPNAEPTAVSHEEHAGPKRIWLFSPGRGAGFWEQMLSDGVMAIGWDELGDLRDYKTQKEISEQICLLEPDRDRPTNDTLACWEFAREIRPGDIAVAKGGVRCVLGYGVVRGEYEYDATRDRFRSRRAVEWLESGKWNLPDDRTFAQKTLTEVGGNPELVGELDKALGVSLAGLEVSKAPQLPEVCPDFTKADALNGLFMTGDQLDVILARLKRKKAIILQGPPGVGKTYIARRLAFSLMGKRDDHRVAMVQFHPSYGYEDFVQGYRPTRSGGLERRDGVFYQFARLARNDPKRDWFFVIDEINRGNLAKIFGELLMLIEADKRGPDHSIPLTYSEQPDETFHLPSNLHFIGTMNTADRSLAMVDYALRRRFAFVTLNPAFDSPVFAAWLTERGSTAAMIARIRERIGALNAVIEKERDLGPGFCVGHSFFCPPTDHAPDEAWYREVIEGEIQPLLQEYFDSRERVDTLVSDLLA